MASEFLTAVAIGLYVIMTITLVGNLVYLRRKPPSGTGQEPLVSILIPARNEAMNLRRLLPALASQTYPRLEVIVYDDESTDKTWEVIQSHQGGRIFGIRGGELPEGWVGKCNAVDQAAKRASGDVLMFLDADARLGHDRVVHELVTQFTALPPFGVLTVLPGLEPGGGRLLVSLIPNAILLTIPWFLTSRWRIPALAALNGQCWMIDAEDYRALEPHDKRRSEILEDVTIGQDLVAAGMRIHLVATRGTLNIRMYDSIGEAWRGFRKNAYLIHGGTPLRFVFAQCIFIFVFFAAPFLDLGFLLWLFLLKWGTDRAVGFKIFVTIFMPLSYILGFLLDWDSAWHHARRRVEWKGRIVS